MSDAFKPLLKAVEKAFKKLHKKGKYSPHDLDTVAEYKTIIEETTGILNRAFEDNDLSDELLGRLENDVFLFSSLKTHAQLFEASRLLLTKDKTIKSFAQFSKGITSIKKNYNENYLEAEYDFAVGTVQMAERWESFKEGDKYYLQYRTAGDAKVRDSHAVLHNITLPKSDPFWNLYFAPNGWRCRCTVVQVLAYSNEKSNSKKAIKSGEKATTQIGKKGKNKLEIFRFNPAKQKVIFPPNHPYHKIAGANKVKAAVKKQKDA
ncbi:phage minor head protein [Tenacibaculum maritimum]|nr:phage minor head protein [Tenacibaculum maritimum]MDB0610439.1 phage minor head protein [Tenacibaculum maritimum]